MSAMTEPVEAVASTSAPAVRLRGARRTFTAELAPVRALRGVDLDVAAGEFLAVMGPSGCGKSTLLNIIAGLDTVDDGTVEVAGQRIDGTDENWLARFRRHHIGIVFQFFNLLDGVSALDNIVLPGVLGGMRRKAAESRARELLDLLGLGDRSAAGAGRAVRWSAPTARDRAGPGQLSRRCCWPTSPPAPSTVTAASRCSSCSAACTTPGRRS